MKSFKLKLLPEKAKDGSIGFDSVSSQEKSKLYENVAVELHHRVLFCHPTTANDAGLASLHPVVVQMFDVYCKDKKITTTQPQSCFIVVTLIKLPQNIAFVSQEGIVQHLSLLCSSACCLQEHLSRARLAVRMVQHLVPAQTISLRPDFHYDSGVSRQTCHAVIMYKMKVRNAPYSGHPFLFAESSRIFIGNVLWKRYLTVTSITPAPENSEHPILNLTPEGLYYADSDVDEDWENLFGGNDRGESGEKNGGRDKGKIERHTTMTGVGDDNKPGHLPLSSGIGDASRHDRSDDRNCRSDERTHDLTENRKRAQFDILNNTGNENDSPDDECVLTSPANTPVTKLQCSVNSTQMLETPKSHNDTSKVFVHSISRSSFSAPESSEVNETGSLLMNKTNHLDSESDNLTLYYITSKTRIVLQSPDPRDDEDDQKPVMDENEPYYYNPQVEVLKQRLSTCVSFLRDIGRRQCLRVKCGVVVHGAPVWELELMVKQAARQLGLHTLAALCDFSSKQEVVKLYASAKRRSPAVVLVKLGDIFLCDSIDGQPNPAVPVLLEAMQAVLESRSAVVTVCLCNKIEKLSNKVRKALGFDVYNTLPDVRVREKIILEFLKHKGYSIQSDERESDNSFSSTVQEINEEYPEERGQHPSSGINSPIAKTPQRSVHKTGAYFDGDKVDDASKSTPSNDMENTATASKSKLCRAGADDMRCPTEDVVALAHATEYCSCAEVHEIVQEKLEKKGNISGGLPEDFVPHLITANDRGFVPPTRWSDILGYTSLKGVLQRMVRLYREDPEHNPLQGLLLYGPPGCSKTMFVKALATETSFSYFLILGSVVLSKYVGETEQHLRGVVQRAKAAAPSIVFIDELESLCGDRGAGSAGAPVALLLELMSSCAPTPQDPLTSVLFVGATNMPHLIDQGLLQAGYLSHVVHVGLPDCASRCALWERILSRVAWKEDGIDVRQLCRLTQGFSGAEIRGIYNEAGHKLLRSLAEHTADSSTSRPTVTQELLVDTIRAASSRIPASLLAAIDDFTASRIGVIEAS